jgi:hypothetical protein
MIWVHDAWIVVEAEGEYVVPKAVPAKVGDSNQPLKVYPVRVGTGSVRAVPPVVKLPVSELFPPLAPM